MKREQPCQPILCKYVQCGLFRNLGGREQACRRHHDGELRHQIAAALDTAIDSHATAAGRLGFSNGRIEKFGNSDAVEHLAHGIFPEADGVSILLPSRVFHNRELIPPRSLALGTIAEIPPHFEFASVALRIRSRSCVLWGLRTWRANHGFQKRNRQISGRTKMSAKISAHGKGKFLSRIWSGSLPRASLTNSLPRSPTSISAPRAVGGAGRAGRAPTLCAASWSISSRGSNFERRSS